MHNTNNCYSTSCPTGFNGPANVHNVQKLTIKTKISKFQNKLSKEALYLNNDTAMTAAAAAAAAAAASTLVLLLIIIIVFFL